MAVVAELIPRRIPDIAPVEDDTCRALPGVLVPIPTLPILVIRILSVLLVSNICAKLSLVPRVRLLPRVFPLLQANGEPTRQVLDAACAASTSITSPAAFTDKTFPVNAVVVALLDNKLVNLNPELPAVP